VVLPATITGVPLELEKEVDAPTHFVIADGDRVVGVITRE